MSSSFVGRGVRVLALAALWLPAPAAVAQEVAAAAGGDGVQRVAIVGGSYFFRPAQIVARAGQPLELRLSVEPGLIPHRFVLEGPGGQPLADVVLGPQEQTVRLSLAAGTYAFYCPNRLLLFPSHREHGMAGVLRVQE